MSAALGDKNDINKGFYFMMDELPRERLGCSVDALSQLEYAFEITRKYTKNENFSNSQHIRHAMANIKTDIVTCRVMVDECVRLFMNVSIYIFNYFDSKYVIKLII